MSQLWIHFMSYGCVESNLGQLHNWTLHSICLLNAEFATQNT